jgi:23S rRNA (uracil1939-C5)-methyltransferase
MNRVLANSVVAALRPRPGDLVVDLFCGIGNFSLVIARVGGRVIGVEASASAISAARSNALLNGVDSQCEFQVADLYDPGYEFPRDAQHLLLDPPRSGVGPHLVNWLRSRALQRVVYVSCNPETFASDAAVLSITVLPLRRSAYSTCFPTLPTSRHLVYSLVKLRRVPEMGLIG